MMSSDYGLDCVNITLAGRSTFKIQLIHKEVLCTALNF